MPIIGATQLEPIAPVSNYLAGVQTARNAMLQQQEMAMAQRKFQREEETAAAAARRAAQVNALVASKGNALTPEDFIGIGALEEAEQLAKVNREVTGGKKASLDLVGAAMDTSARLLDSVTTPEEFLVWHESNHADPVLGSYLADRGITAEQSRQKILAASQDPAAFQQLLLDSRLGLEKSRKQHFQSQNFGGGQRVIRMSEYGGPATEVAGSRIAETPLPANVVAQKERVARAGAGQNITVQERAEQGKYGELLVANYARLQERAESGRRFLSTIEQAKRSLADGLRTGFGADTIRLGARILAALGEPEAEKKAANADLFLAAVKENVLRRQIEQKGPQTESDAQRIEETFIRLGTPTLANEFMLDVANAQIKRDNEQQRFFDKWRRDTGSFDGAEEAWIDGEGGRSLFERSELKKYTTPEGASGIPKIGAVDNGYRFKGGNPADPKSWEKVR